MIRERAFAPVFRSFRDLVGTDIAAVAFASLEADQAKHLGEICASGSGYELLVVELSGRAVGFVAFKVDPGRGTGEIGLNAVDPDHAARGIGSWMYREVLGRMKALGALTAEVGTGGDASHEAARRAYAKVGFKAAVPGIYFYKLL